MKQSSNKDNSKESQEENKDTSIEVSEERKIKIPLKVFVWLLSFLISVSISGAYFYFSITDSVNDKVDKATFMLLVNEFHSHKTQDSTNFEWYKKEIKNDLTLIKTALKINIKPEEDK
jgi:Na+-transporting NADH:ubiquinone oxidoreductase subunit NqrC